MNLFDVYTLYDIEPVRGRGSYVYTSDGTEYLDLYGGHAVISVGHAHPVYVKAVCDQAGRLGFYSNSVQNSLQQQFAQKLGRLSGYDDYNLFLCNSGAEANENALKLASFATGRNRVLAFDKAFHGRTAAAVAVTDNPSIRAPFGIGDKVDTVALGDIGAVRRALQTGRYAAAIVEGIQGVAGIRVPGDIFMQQLAYACSDTGTLLVCDEVQSGYGRTGRFFAHLHSGIRPDIITSAKGIANGFPMAAVLIAPHIAARKGMLGTTFGGSHLACAAGIAVLDIIENEDLVQNAARTGAYIIDRLKANPLITGVRGRGLMIGFEARGFDGPTLRRKLLFEHRIFTGGAGKDTVRLLPALSLTKAQADVFFDALDKIFTQKTD